MLLPDMARNLYYHRGLQTGGVSNQLAQMRMVCVLQLISITTSRFWPRSRAKMATAKSPTGCSLLIISGDYCPQSPLGLPLHPEMPIGSR